MSKRPTTNARKNCSTAHTSTNTYGYAIIGDTVSSTLYAKRLLGNRVTTQITLINEGVDRTNQEGILDVSFPVDNANVILHYLGTEQLHYIPAGDDQDEDDDEIDDQVNHVIQYLVGAGPLGDFISAYYTPELGPWFPHTSDTHMERFLLNHTTNSPLNDQELTVAKFVQKTWNIKWSNSPSVTEPSIFNLHRIFTSVSTDELSREIFLEQYALVNEASNVDIVTEVVNLHMTPTGSTGGLYNITGKGVDLHSVRPIWRLNPYTFLRLASTSGFSNKSMQLPTTYRAVISIPLVNGDQGVNLSGLTARGDLTTTSGNFSLYDLNNPKHGSLVWLVHFYTAVEDLSVVSTAGKYADTGRTLLIVEAIDTKNRRKALYNGSEDEVQVNYNSRLVERGHLKQFARIVANIYQAYTGAVISVDDLIKEASVCVPSGTCQDNELTRDFTHRETPVESILLLVSYLYGMDIYPRPGGC